MMKADFTSMYSWVYHGFTEEFKLKSVSVILLAIILSFHENGKQCWLSLDSLAVLTGSTPPTVLKHLDRLSRLRLIERRPPTTKYGTNHWGLGFEGAIRLERYKRKIEVSKESKQRIKENVFGL